MKNEVYIDYENSIGPWLGKTVMLIAHYLMDVLKNEGLDITKDQIVLLKKLYFKDGINQNDLAFMMFRNKSSLARMLKIMERKGFIKREKSKIDKRNNHVFLTDLGRETFERIQPLLKDLIEKEEKGITIEEKKIVISVLKKMQSNIGVKSEIL